MGSGSPTASAFDVGDIEEILAEARESFRRWAETALAEAKAAAPALGTADFVDAWETVFGVFHDLKGGGGSVDLWLVTRIGDSACRHLKGQEAPDRRRAALALAHISAAEGVLAAEIRGEGGEAGRRLLAKLQALA